MGWGDIILAVFIGAVLPLYISWVIVSYGRRQWNRGYSAGVNKTLSTLKSEESEN